ncbi:hypothetical protein AOQ84DRAFT_437829, partial [Glonium stellatum]
MDQILNEEIQWFQFEGDNPEFLELYLDGIAPMLHIFPHHLLPNPLLHLKSNIPFKASLFLQASPSLSTEPPFAMADLVTPKNRSIPHSVPPTPAVRDAIVELVKEIIKLLVNFRHDLIQHAHCVRILKIYLDAIKERTDEATAKNFSETKDAPEDGTMNGLEAQTSDTMPETQWTSNPQGSF